jgi:hypothetical protein
VWKVRRAQAQVVSFIIMAIALVLGASIKKVFPGLSRDGQLLALFMLVGVAFLIHERWIPLLVQLEPPAPGELLRPSRRIDEELADDPQYQEDCREADEQTRWIEEMNDPARKPWRCVSCGEENPATFDVCWNCQKPNENQQEPLSR